MQRDKLYCGGQGRSTRDLSHPAVHTAEVEISAQSSRLSEYEHYFLSLCVFLWEQVLIPSLSHAYGQSIREGRAQLASHPFLIRICDVLWMPSLPALAGPTILCWCACTAWVFQCLRSCYLHRTGVVLLLLSMLKLELWRSMHGACNRVTAPSLLLSCDFQALNCRRYRFWWMSRVTTPLVTHLLPTCKRWALRYAACHRMSHVA